MSDWAPKRFWKDTQVVEAEGGFAIHLDGRPVRSPAKTLLVVPTRALAETVAAEWEAQTDKVDPGTMPFTKLSNSALDKVIPQFDAVAEMISEFGGSDLLCYRADGPEALCARQAQGWDPLLGWARDDLGIDLAVQTGVMPVGQSVDCQQRISARTREMAPFGLAAFHDMVALTGSWVLGYAAAQDRQKPDSLWALSRIDEDWQREQWGADEEADARAAFKREEFLTACRFFSTAING